jgi:hypothetical protein
VGLLKNTLRPKRKESKAAHHSILLSGGNWVGLLKNTLFIGRNWSRTVEKYSGTNTRKESQKSSTSLNPAFIGELGDC